MASKKNAVSLLPDPEDFNAPEGWCPVAVYATTQQAHEAGLAILAMGHAYWLQPHEDSYIICVAESKLVAIHRELEVMQRMGHHSIPRGRPVSHIVLDCSGWSFLLYALLLSACFAVQSLLPIQSAGRVDAVRMVEQGEWWRALTALTLHGDVVHLASNVVAGMGFAFLLARFFGAGAAWLLILFSGTAGNALNAWVHYPEAHLSIGASTAVFGALGLITGVGLWIALLQPAERWTMPRWLLPAFGGLTLLGLLGIGDGLDMRVDVAAHFSGFLCGSLLGFVCATRQAAFVRWNRYGRWVGLVAIAFIGFAWLMALFT
ncbi:MAG: rhomboid family intramembrane serine protease [Opitutales bacterium]